MKSFFPVLLFQKIFLFLFFYTMLTLSEHSLVMRNGPRPNILLNLDYDDIFIDNALKAFSMLKKGKEKKKTHLKGNTGNKLLDIGLCNTFLDLFLQARATKVNQQLGLYQIKKLLHSEGNDQQNRKATC